MWWSKRDRIVGDQRYESGLLYRDVKRLNPAAPVSEFVGTWAHTTEMASHVYLPYALSRFGLLVDGERADSSGDDNRESGISFHVNMSRTVTAKQGIRQTH